MPMRRIDILRPLTASLAMACSAAVSGAAMPSAGAAELIMLERPGCMWCARWDREIAPIYPLTAESRVAPLRRVDVTGRWPADLAAIAADRYTPTFIVVEGGVEIARLRGYPGEEFFWPMLEEMVSQLCGADSN